MPQTPRFYDPDYIASTIQESDNFISPNKARNYIINGAFDFWQRGTSFALDSNTYCTDRFVIASSGGGGTPATGTVTRQSLPLGTSGVQDQQYFLRINNTSVGSSLGATSVHVFTQRIEDVRTLSEKTVTVSIWMSASTAKQVALYSYQYFGTGGSSRVNINCSQNGIKTLNSTITRYDFTVNVPSISGKTVGPDSFVEFGLLLQSGPTEIAVYGYPSAYLNWGATGNIDIYRFQVNEGSAVGIPFSRAGANIAEELSICQRYCFVPVNNSSAMDGAWFVPLQALTTTFALGLVPIPVSFRATPSLSYGALASYEIINGTSIFTPSAIIVSPDSSSNMCVIRADIGSPGYTVNNYYHLRYAVGSPGGAAFILSSEL